MKKLLFSLFFVCFLAFSSICFAGAATVAQANADLSSSALTLTLNANREVEVYWIGLSFTNGSGTITATSETVVFQIVDEADSDYNIELFYEALTSERGVLWIPDAPFRVNATQQVKVTCTNGNATNYAYATISYRPL